jgi:hypothetical protein
MELDSLESSKKTKRNSELSKIWQLPRKNFPGENPQIPPQVPPQVPPIYLEIEG